MKYNIHKTDIETNQKIKIDAIIDDAFSLCHCSGLWQRVDITEKNDDIIVFNNIHQTNSKKLIELLKDSNAAVFMAVTAGKDIIEAISEKSAAQKTTEALIFDAVGSETADSSMDWLVSYINQNLVRSSEILTKFRFSPGYGDLFIDFQKEIDTVLQLKNINVVLNNRLILQPEKSVTAIAGII